MKIKLSTIINITFIFVFFWTNEFLNIENFKSGEEDFCHPPFFMQTRIPAPRKGSVWTHLYQSKHKLLFVEVELLVVR